MNILVVAPHPDDETLGCGGTLLRHKENGDHLFWLIVTALTEAVGYNEQQIRTRVEEIKTISETYGFKKTFSFTYATTTLDTVARRELVGAVSTVVDEVQPEILYVPNRSDIHSDHRITFDALMGATKTFRAPSVKRVLVYEVVSETDFAPAFQSDAFVPNSFSDISKYLEKKIEIMKLYKSEFGVHPFPRSEGTMRALATVRGATAGVQYAESFMLLKEIK